MGEAPALRVTVVDDHPTRRDAVGATDCSVESASRIELLDAVLGRDRRGGLHRGARSGWCWGSTADGRADLLAVEQGLDDEQ